MTQEPNITTQTIDPIGVVELAGTGPWSVRESSRSSFDIVDSQGIVCNPAVTNTARGGRGTKRNAGVIYADKAIPNTIVAAFNAALAAA